MKYAGPLLWLVVGAYWLVLRGRLRWTGRSAMITTLEIVGSLALLYLGSAIAAGMVKPRI